MCHIVVHRPKDVRGERRKSSFSQNSILVTGNPAHKHSTPRQKLVHPHIHMCTYL